ncbi:sporulation protein [Lampropedia puyangensis]|uniref:Sporulation protein n=1 Tax=Lampropedia puyangensis TaxID=1330072 RepID=A0A4S8EQ18_9BURK|nr:SPOR domain-containing protein [Lampropedia puyangensis]THT96416.1 sporulation protein [Lampropedia puyangensis]
MAKKTSRNKTGPQQRGGTLAGILIGLTLGGLIAIGVALYVSKMPIPFLNTSANTRPSALDSTEDERNRSWNPNAALSGNRSSGATTTQTQRPLPPASPSQDPSPPVLPEPPSEVVAVAPSTTPGNADPLGELAARVGNRPAPAETASTPPAAADPYQYFVQAGAYRTQADADSQRARLAMNGWDARITSREAQGQTVYRVRVGPFSKSEDAANIKRQFDHQGFDSAVVRQAR